LALGVPFPGEPARGRFKGSSRAKPAPCPAPRAELRVLEGDARGRAPRGRARPPCFPLLPVADRGASRPFGCRQGQGSDPVTKMAGNVSDPRSASRAHRRFDGEDEEVRAASGAERASPSPRSTMAGRGSVSRLSSGAEPPAGPRHEPFFFCAPPGRRKRGEAAPPAPPLALPASPRGGEERPGL
jgi:hypothetical protein